MVASLELFDFLLQVVEYKQSSRMEEKRKKALDLHLSFIVDQTEKYSSWLTEGFAAAPSTSSMAGSSSIGQSGMEGKHEVTERIYVMNSSFMRTSDDSSN